MTDGVLATVSRGDFIESRHYGHAAIISPAGELTASIGNPDELFYPRSALKPLQAAAMATAGLDVDEEELALTCASHSGESRHRAIVERMLSEVGLTTEDLDNTPGFPLSEAEKRTVPSSRLAQNCSGHHAGLLVTCEKNGWDTSTYLEERHPVQQLIATTIAELTGDRPQHVTIDGCGSPLFAVTVAGMARAFLHMATTNSPIYRAMIAHPFLVGGTGRDVTEAMMHVPGLMAKDGAEGVYAAAHPDLGALAFKIGDGSSRPRAAILAGMLEYMGVDESDLTWGITPVLGHGKKVGKVSACVPSSRK